MSIRTIIDWLCGGRRKDQPQESLSPETDLPRQVNLLSANERDKIVARHLRSHLEPLGFVEVAPRRWVNGSVPPARQLFQMSLFRGASMRPSWGFSLDFVPHLSGHRICWHRTDRTAKLDVFVDPPDGGEACFLWGAEWLDRDLKQLLPAAIERARDTWRRGETWPGKLDIVREIRERKTNRLWLDYYSQLSLAFIFLSAKTGDLAEAQAELDICVRKWDLPEKTATKLADLVQTLHSARE